MYSKAESAHIKTSFWISYGQYMKPIANANGEDINWVNYKTGKKNVFFRMHFDKKIAKIFIEISCKNEEERIALYQKILMFKEEFETIVGSGFDWVPNAYDDYGKPVSVIVKTIENVSIFKKEDWPEVISFFKTSMIQLDAFWVANKDFIIQ